jgi:pimeloyl-ACP methyl ester carboxylesterase
MINFVLIHGAWHTGEHLTPIVRHLELRGHRAVAPTLPGRGPAAQSPVTHAHLVAGVADFIREHDLHNIVLVGHSFGGSIIARLAEEVPDRIRRLVFWNAFIPSQGRCVMDDLPPGFRAMMQGSGDTATDQTMMLPYPIWRDVFINDADENLAKAAYETLCREPVQPSLDLLDLRRFYQTTIPKSYLNCTEDIALPPGEWGWHPRMSSRLGVYRLVQMPGSHEVLFTNPAGVSGKLIEAGRD